MSGAENNNKKHKKEWEKTSETDTARIEFP